MFLRRIRNDEWGIYSAVSVVAEFARAGPYLSLWSSSIEGLAGRDLHRSMMDATGNKATCCATRLRRPTAPDCCRLCNLSRYAGQPHDKAEQSVSMCAVQPSPSLSFPSIGTMMTGSPSSWFPMLAHASDAPGLAHAF